MSNLTILMSIAVASSLSVACGMNYKDFEAVTVNRSGSFELDMPPAQALPLFTAPGETLWISNWDPIILHGDGYEEGSVWVTSDHGHTTYWYVATYDTDAKHAQYVRVTPDADTGTVDVHLAQSGTGGSKVTVTYQLTGLSAAGNRNVQRLLGQAAYAAMMEDWREMILQSRPKIDDHLGR